MKLATLLKYAVIFFISANSIWLSFANERLIFGTENYAPYNFLDEDSGMLTGFSYDVVKALIAHTGDEELAEIRVYPWARIYYMAQNMENVAIFSMVHSQQRSKLFKWVGTLYFADSYIWKMRDRHDIIIKGKQDLKRYQTAVLNDGVDQQILSQWYGLVKGQHLMPVSSANQKLLMLFNGHVDLSEYAEMPMRWKMHTMSLDFNQVEKIMAIPEMAPLALAFSLQTKDVVVERYRRALNTIKQNGTYDEILKRWLLPDSIAPQQHKMTPTTRKHPAIKSNQAH